MKNQPVVTAEQIGRCHRFVIDNEGRSVWGVESESVFDIDGRPIEYAVYLDTNTCSCPAFHFSKGQTCKHLNWARAADREERTALAEIAHREAEDELHTLSVNGCAPSQAVAKRILTAPAAPVVNDRSTASIHNNRGFCMMK